MTFIERRRACRYCGRHHPRHSYTPQAIRSLPHRSVERTHSVLPTVIVMGIFLGIAVLNGLVPRVADLIGSVLR